MAQRLEQEPDGDQHPSWEGVPKNREDYVGKIIPDPSGGAPTGLTPDGKVINLKPMAEAAGALEPRRGPRGVNTKNVVRGALAAAVVTGTVAAATKFDTIKNFLGFGSKPNTKEATPTAESTQEQTRGATKLPPELTMTPNATEAPTEQAVVLNHGEIREVASEYAGKKVEGCDIGVDAGGRGFTLEITTQYPAIPFKCTPKEREAFDVSSLDNLTTTLVGDPNNIDPSIKKIVVRLMDIDNLPQDEREALRGTFLAGGDKNGTIISAVESPSWDPQSGTVTIVRYESGSMYRQVFENIKKYNSEHNTNYDFNAIVAGELQYPLGLLNKDLIGGGGATFAKKVNDLLEEKYPDKDKLYELEKNMIPVENSLVSK